MTFRENGVLRAMLNIPQSAPIIYRSEALMNAVAHDPVSKGEVEFNA